MVRRYIMFQLPGWLGTVLVLTALQLWLGFSVWFTGGALVLLLLKDLLLFPITRHAYDPSPTPPYARLLGKEIVAGSEGERRGYVKLDGEWWKAMRGRWLTANGGVSSVCRG